MNNLSANVDIPPSALVQKALDLSASGVLVCELIKPNDTGSAQFLIQLANKRVLNVLGFEQNALMGQFAHKFFTDSTTQSLWIELERVITSNESSQLESFYAIPLTGVVDWFTVLIEPVGDNRSAVVSFTPITTWKQTEQHLLEDSILFKTLSSTVPEMGVVAVDFFRKIALANGLIPGLFKSNDPNELVGRRFIETIHSEFANDWVTYIATAFEGAQHVFTDQWDGWRCEVYVGPVRNANGQIVMVLTVFKNVSEQFQQQQALQQANSSLHRSNENLERFAYVASHDLQEPLRKIRSFGELLSLRYGEQLDELGRDMLNRMQSAAQRMDELIRSLLTFSRINTPTFTAAPIALEKLLLDIEADLEVVIQERKAVISFDSTLPTVWGDEAQLRQLFQNLLTNALKFVAPGMEPRIRISSRFVDAMDVPNLPETHSSSTNQFAEISVADNGIGIDPVNYEKIFGLFTRLHGRTAYEGTGIGLATTKRVAENHGGAVAVESEPEKGTTFRVYLPVTLHYF